jgi:hypothetical protein
MNIYYEWADQDHTTLTVHFSQGWTFAEHEACYLTTKDLIAEQPNVVNVIWDFSQVTTMPLHALTNFSAFDKRIGIPANFGRLVIATNPRFVDTMINVACRTFANRRNRILMAESAEAAYDLLLDRSERIAVLH